MVPPTLLDRVVQRARRHCASKGFVSGPNWNPLEPRDPVAALAMARLLIESRQFDHYVAVAPEGHSYGFFFERLGVGVASVFVDYPPREISQASELSEVGGGRVLLIEDDVVSGLTLELVVAALEAHRPASISVYLGRPADSQCPENVPPSVATVYLAETHLDPACRPRHEEEFIQTFSSDAARDFPD
ncbi:MAG: hypothetical protein AB7I30_15240 [Isosphaeraceae bacterium]